MVKERQQQNCKRASSDGPGIWLGLGDLRNGWGWKYWIYKRMCWEGSYQCSVSSTGHLTIKAIFETQIKKIQNNPNTKNLCERQASGPQMESLEWAYCNHIFKAYIYHNHIFKSGHQLVTSRHVSCGLTISFKCWISCQDFRGKKFTQKFRFSASPEDSDQRWPQLAWPHPPSVCPAAGLIHFYPDPKGTWLCHSCFKKNGMATKTSEMQEFDKE